MEISFRSNAQHSTTWSCGRLDTSQEESTLSSACIRFNSHRSSDGTVALFMTLSCRCSDTVSRQRKHCDMRRSVDWGDLPRPTRVLSDDRLLHDRHRAFRLATFPQSFSWP